MTSHAAPRPTGVASPPRFPRPVWVAHVAGFGMFVVVPLLLLDANRLEAFDLAIYDQSIWLLAHGLDFNTVAGIHVFGAHFSPVLYLLQPLAALPGGAVPELVLEAWVLALSVFPLHRLCVRLERQSNAFLVLFVVHPAIFTASWYGFHPWTLAAPFLILSVLALMSRPDWWVLSIFGIFGIALREDIGFWVVLLAAMLVIAGHLPWRQWLWGAIVPGFASIAVVFWVMPALSPVGDYLYGSSYLGQSTSVNITEFAASSLVRTAYLVLPLGMGLAALRRLRWPVAIPLLIPLVGLGLRDGNALATAFHYDLHLAIGVMLLVALSFSVEPSSARVLVGSLVAALAFGALRPTTPEIGPNPWGLVGNDRELVEVGDAIRALDDGQLSMSVPAQLVPHFSERARIFIFPWPFDQVSPVPYPMECPWPDIVVADRSVPSAPVWGEASTQYELFRFGERYSVYVYAGPAPVDASCGPA